MLGRTNDKWTQYLNPNKVGFGVKFVQVIKGLGRFYLDFARENRFRALFFERRFLHEFLSYTYDFFSRKKVRKYILKSKSFLPHQKVFYPLFRSFLEYFVNIFGICEKIIDFGFQKFIFSKFFKLCVYGSYLVFTNSNHLIWTPKPFYVTSCHV